MNKTLLAVASTFILAIVINSNAQLPSFSCSMGNPYIPISGSPGPSGDDVTITVPIGFNFNYIGISYTQASICTNGFIILGTSTFNGFTNSLCGNNPGQNPMLSPFWDDLNTSNGGHIKYITLGAAPNRVFIVQYDSVAFFSGSGRVTFQLRLYETTNLIDFLYGPGVANPAATGSIGLTDAVGGAGHCMSVAPGPTCDSTRIYFNVSNDLIPYIFPNLGNGVKYTFGNAVGIINNQEIPRQYMLYDNYPNPFNPTTIIKFDIPLNVKRETSNVKLIVYDVLGKEVATLVNEPLKPGSYESVWDGSNFASGLYIYKLESDELTDTKKMLLIK